MLGKERNTLNCHSGESFITGKEVEGLPLVSIGISKSYTLNHVHIDNSVTSSAIVPLQSLTPSSSSTVSVESQNFSFSLVPIYLFFKHIATLI